MYHFNSLTTSSIPPPPTTIIGLFWQSVNQSFADAVQDVYRDGDLIWVHDYHLTMVPQMLRNVLPSAKIGFFLHLPFPSSEVTRLPDYRS